MKNRPELKTSFVDRMKILLGDSEDFKDYLEILKFSPVKSIRCNTLKSSVKELKKRLEKKGWKIKQPWKKYPEIMIIESNLNPGELGNSLEHLLGYFYIQELASTLPIISLNVKPNQRILDLCASPGSKTTQIASSMKNSGLIIANEISLKRIKILSSNLERCGVTNAIITRKEGNALCRRLKNLDFKFDKILVDAPCSGEGTLRSSKQTYYQWNLKIVKSLPRLQKSLFASAFELLKIGGEIIYSTCTHAPEENEGVVNWALENFKGEIGIEKIELPVTTRPGICSWEKERYSNKLKDSCRIYPQDNNTEGFFITKFKRIK